MMDKKYKIICAENSGFCFGVRRAVEIITDLRKSTDKTIYTIGELIHNPVFVKRLEKDNVFSIDTEQISSLEDKKDSIVLVIRTHGIQKSVLDYIKNVGFEYVDATCPFVKRIHDIVDRNSKDAKAVIVVGDKKHPEVIGIKSYAHTDAFVCDGEQELQAVLNKNEIFSEDCIILTSQTTYNNEKYVNCQNLVRKLYTNSKIFDTICSVTEKRQNEVKELSKTVDIMIVVGGKKSSNTKKLFDISLEKCQNTFLVETKEELPKEIISDICNQIAKNGVGLTIGITAGASTPDDILEEVKVRVEQIIMATFDETTKWKT